MENNQYEKFNKKYGEIRKIKDERAKSYLLSLASFVEHNATGADRINKSAVCVLLAQRIIELEGK